MLKKMVNVATPKVVELYQSSIGRGIRRLQKRLAKKAIREPEHKFDDLYNLTYNPEWVQASLKFILKRYMPKKKLNPFLTYQYEVEYQNDVLDKWEGRSGNQYASDEYWTNKKLAVKRDKRRCRLCGKKVTEGIDNHCHHIDGNSSNHSLDNLVTLCMECHFQTYGKEHEYIF
jgi:hypothetical protein